LVDVSFEKSEGNGDIENKEILVDAECSDVENKEIIATNVDV